MRSIRLLNILSYTNYTYSIRPGFCEPALAFATNYTTNILTRYQYTFFNVITNSYYTNTYQTVITTNIAPFTNGLVGKLTNFVSTNVVYSSQPSGDFWIVPPTWCGYQPVGLLTNLVFSTKCVWGDERREHAGQQYTVTTVSEYTNHTLAIRPGVCESAWRSRRTTRQHPDESIKLHVLQRDHEQLTTPTRISWW